VGPGLSVTYDITLFFSDLQLTVIVVCNLKLIVNPIAVSLLFTFTVCPHQAITLLSLSLPHFFVCIAHSSFLYLHYLPPFSLIPSQAFSVRCVARRQDSLPIMSAQRGSAITSAGAHETGVRGRVWRGMGVWEIKKMADRVESVELVVGFGLILVGLIAFF